MSSGGSHSMCPDERCRKRRHCLTDGKTASPIAKGWPGHLGWPRCHEDLEQSASGLAEWTQPDKRMLAPLGDSSDGFDVTSRGRLGEVDSSSIFASASALAL